MQSLILASSSPRRSELLRQLSLPFVVHTAEVDETPATDESSQAYVLRMSRAKAEASLASLDQGTSSADRRAEHFVLAADTIGVLDADILVKPQSREDYTQMMRKMSGRTHTVITSMCVLAKRHDGSSLCKQLNVHTEVRFKSLSQDEIDAYWRTGEPLDKAGGYGIQSKGALFVDGISGSYSNVVGLPLKECAELLQETGYDVWTAMQI